MITQARQVAQPLIGVDTARVGQAMRGSGPTSGDERRGELPGAECADPPVLRMDRGGQSLIGEGLIEVFGLPDIDVARPGVVATSRVADPAFRVRVPNPACWALYFLAGQVLWMAARSPWHGEPCRARGGRMRSANRSRGCSWLPGVSWALAVGSGYAVGAGLGLYRAGPRARRASPG